MFLKISPSSKNPALGCFCLKEDGRLLQNLQPSEPRARAVELLRAGRPGKRVSEGKYLSFSLTYRVCVFSFLRFFFLFFLIHF